MGTWQSYPWEHQGARVRHLHRAERVRLLHVRLQQAQQRDVDLAQQPAGAACHQPRQQLLHRARPQAQDLHSTHREGIAAVI